VQALMRKIIGEKSQLVKYSFHYTSLVIQQLIVYTSHH